jgi:hypothetical protein
LFTDGWKVCSWEVLVGLLQAKYYESVALPLSYRPESI